MKRNILLIVLALALLISCEDEKPLNSKVVIVPNLNNYPVSSLAFDANDVLWVGTDTGLFKQVAEGFQLIGFNNDAPVTALAAEKSSGALWVGTLEGLSKLTFSGSKINVENIQEGNLSSTGIRAIHIDDLSVNWFATDTGITRNNLNIWQKEKFKKNLSGTITPLDFERLAVNSIASWDGDYFFAINGIGLYRTFNWNSTADAFTGATQWDSPYNGFAITDTMYVVFVDSQGRQWMGGREGLQVHSGHLPTQENTSFYDELVNPYVHCVAEAPDGKIWAGTENGISIYDEISWTALNTSLPDNFITALAFDKDGNAIIGTKKGLAVLPSN